jgi:hypothetical protein
MKVRTMLLTLASIPSLIACNTEPESGSSARVAVRVNQVDVTSGSVAGLVRNVGDNSLWYGGCWAGVESDQSGTWTRLPSDRGCDMFLGELQPGKSAAFEVELPGTTASCQLRVTVGLFTSDTPGAAPGVTGVSDPFCPDA